jgi:hypothetical protein
VAAAVFFAGVLFGSAGRSEDPAPQPVVVRVAGTQPAPEGGGEPRNAPAPDDLDVAEVEYDVEEGYVEDYGDGDNSGPGSDDSGSGSDNSGPGSDSSGSGSDSSGSGSSGSGSGGSGSG